MDENQLLKWDSIVASIKENQGHERAEDISKFIEIITENIYTEETYDCMDYLKEKLEDTEVWQEIEHKVYSKTDFYIKTIELRKIPEDEVISKLELIYDYLYKQFESEEYITSKTGITEAFIKTVERVFTYCENVVILRKISKRRFYSYLVEFGKFSEVLIEKLWNIFNGVDDSLKNIIFMRRFFDLELKVNYLLRGQDEIGEEINFLEFLLLDGQNEES